MKVHIKHNRRKLSRVLTFPVLLILLASLLIVGLPLGTNNKAVSAADGVFYDFISKASSASWASGAGSLPFPGSDSDSRGFALYRDKAQLEDGSTRARVLETHPQWVSNGWIMGAYPQLTIPSEAELKVTVGFFKGATATDGVTFEVQFEEFRGLTAAPKKYSVLSQRATYDSKLDSISKDLNYLAGKTGNFILYVNAGQNSGKDWAAWAEAKIETAPPALPDLIVDGIKCDRENSRIGYVLKNIAEGTAKGRHSTTLFVDGKEVTHDLVSVDLKPGETHGSWFQEYKWPECHTIEVKVCADNYNQVKEANEQNNCLQVECVCVGLPDLVATGVEPMPSRVTVGREVCLKPLIENAGVAPSGPCAVKFYIDGEKLVSVDIPAIPAGQSLRDVVEVCAYWTPGETGLHQVEFIADVDRVVDELDEGNNSIEVELNVLPVSADTEPPDVTITYLPENPTDADTVTFSIYATDPSGIGGVTLYVAGSSVTPTLVSETEEEATYSYTAGPYRPGAYQYYLEVWDTIPNRKWTELQQFTVAYSVPFTLDITNSPPEPSSEDEVTFTAVASSPYGVANIRIYLQERKVRECTDSATCEVTRGPFREGETVTYYADARDSLDSYISVPSKSFTVGVPIKPDLIITDIWNEGNTIKYTIKNDGTAPAGESHTNLVIEHAYPSSVDFVPCLGTGAEIERDFSGFYWSCSPPQDVITVVADGNREIDELNETNNVRNETWDCPEHPGDMRYPKDVLTMYSEKEVFLISDENWRNVLQLVPLSTWRAPVTPYPVQKYPLLIYHRESSNFDADSTIHFLRQYEPTNVTIFGFTPPALDSLLVASDPGAHLSTFQITRQPLTIDAYLSYWWINYNILVVSEDDYQVGLMASVFASYINAPLLFDGHFDYDVIKDKSVYIIGSLSSSSLQQIERNAYIIHSSDLPQLQDDYTRLTNTNKVILVNSNDLNIWLGEDLSPERGGGEIHRPFRGISLAAPYLAAATEEVIISVSNGVLPPNPTCAHVQGLTDNFNDVDQFVENEVSRLFPTIPDYPDYPTITPDYLTIVAAPKAIVDSLYRECHDGAHIRTAVDWKYGSLDNDEPTMKVGRIYGVTVSGASAYIARELFYSEIFNNTYASDEYTGLCIGHSFPRYYNNVRDIKQKTTAAGYETRCFSGEDREGCTTAIKPSFDNYATRQFIVFGDHGAPSAWIGTMSTSEVPWLDVSYVFAHACLTNDFWEDGGGKDVLGANLIRKGAMCYFGATGVSFGDNSETRALEHMTGSSRYNIGELNDWLIENFSVYKRDYMMLGDPLFMPVFKEVDWD